MSNPWNQHHKSASLPTGCRPDAVAQVRAAYRLKPFGMAQSLGVTVSELAECEAKSLWPRSENACRKLVQMARAKGVEIAPPDSLAQNDEPSLF